MATEIVRELRETFPTRVKDLTPDVGYELRRWLDRPARAPAPAADDWLAQAFAVASEPALTWKHRRPRLAS